MKIIYYLADWQLQDVSKGMIYIGMNVYIDSIPGNTNQVASAQYIFVEWTNEWVLFLVVCFRAGMSVSSLFSEVTISQINHLRSATAKLLLQLEPRGRKGLQAMFSSPSSNHWPHLLLPLCIVESSQRRGSENTLSKKAGSMDNPKWVTPARKREAKLTIHRPYHTQDHKIPGK